jgi:Pyruvate/2-oxoacid:ferredoxin oxidoreductase gamma subunit/Pyruvate/2-oxoacid:ferredoxin oxidoreductase delta subunit
MNKTSIILSGEGGQGIQTIAKIFSSAAFNNNLEIAYMPSFGVEQRGTPSIAFITVSSSKLRYPKFDIADIVVVLQSRAVSAIEKFISPNTKVIFDSSTIPVSDLPKRAIRLYGVPATKLAQEQFSPKSFNIIIIGALSKQIGIPEKIVWDSIMEVLGKKFKTEEIKNASHEAFLFGRNLVYETKEFSDAIFKPKHKAIVVKGHNKHGEILPQRCKGCGICIEKCPVAALRFGKELGLYATPIPEVDLEKCIACGNCRNFCPDGAISIEKD